MKHQKPHWGKTLFIFQLFYKMYKTTGSQNQGTYSLTRRVWITCLQIYIWVKHRFLMFLTQKIYAWGSRLILATANMYLLKPVWIQFSLEYRVGTIPKLEIFTQFFLILKLRWALQLPPHSTSRQHLIYLHFKCSLSYIPSISRHYWLVLSSILLTLTLTTRRIKYHAIFLRKCVFMRFYKT